MAISHKITPCLWFDTQAEAAAKFYTGIFKNSAVIATTYYSSESAEKHHKPNGSVLSVDFELEGQRFTALNGGPEFKFSLATSFIVSCETQDEIDYYWENLKEDGDPSAQACGWLKDQFGLSWQVVPTILNKMLDDPDQTKTGRVMHALMQMKKLKIITLEAAYRGDPH